MAEIFVESHSPVDQEVVTRGENRVVLLHGLLDRLQRDVRHLGTGNVDSTHGGAKGGLCALVSLHRRVGVEPKRSH